MVKYTSRILLKSYTSPIFYIEEYSIGEWDENNRFIRMSFIREMILKENRKELHDTTIDSIATRES